MVNRPKSNNIIIIIALVFVLIGHIITGVYINNVFGFKNFSFKELGTWQMIIFYLPIMYLSLRMLFMFGKNVTKLSGIALFATIYYTLFDLQIIDMILVRVFYFLKYGFKNINDYSKAIKAINEENYTYKNIDYPTIIFLILLVLFVILAFNAYSKYNMPIKVLFSITTVILIIYLWIYPTLKIIAVWEMNIEKFFDVQKIWLENDNGIFLLTYRMPIFIALALPGIINKKPLLTSSKGITPVTDFVQQTPYNNYQNPNYYSQQPGQMSQNQFNNQGPNYYANNNAQPMQQNYANNNAQPIQQNYANNNAQPIQQDYANNYNAQPIQQDYANNYNAQPIQQDYANNYNAQPIQQNYTNVSMDNSYTSDPINTQEVILENNQDVNNQEVKNQDVNNQETINKATKENVDENLQDSYNDNLNNDLNNINDNVQ